MKKITLLIAVPLCLVLVNHNVVASTPVNTRTTKVNMLFDEDQNINPDLYIPLSWNSSDSFISGVGFHKNETNYNHSITGFDESRINGSIKEDRISVMILNWNSGRPEKQVKMNKSWTNYSLGLVAEYMDIQRNESGYFHYNPDDNGPWVALDNRVNIKFFQPGVYGSLEFQTYPQNIIETLSITSSAVFAPVSFLSVDQETHAMPIVNHPGKSDASETQNPGYALGLNITLTTSWLVDAILECSYEYLPMKYKLSFLNHNSSSNTFSFDQRDVENNESTTVVQIKFRIKKKIQSLYPVIGVKYKHVKTDDNAGMNDSETFNYAVLGFEGTF